MTFTELQAEYRAERIGRLILRQVYGLAKNVVRGYSPEIYLNAHSHEDGLDDFIQEFVTVVLINEGQLDYVMTVAGNTDDFGNLIARQMRRLLARRRRRTVIDNLLDRCRRITQEPPFEIRMIGRSWSYRIAEVAAEVARPDQQALRSAAIGLSLFPVTRSDSSERAPTVYTAEILRDILQFVGRTLGCWVTQSDLHGVFSEALTFLLPRDLSRDEDVILEAASDDINSEEELIVADGVRVVLESLTAAERLVLRMKLSDRSDAEIAKVAGVSRPTVDKRKRAALKKLEFALEDLPASLQSAVMERVSLELAREGA